MKRLRMFLSIALAIAALLCTTPSLHAQRAGIYSGTGSPESHVAANPGDIYVDSGGTFYFKAQGSGNTGWVALSGGGGTPGGSSGQIQYNNSGAFGGVAVTGSGSVVEGTAPTLTNPVVGTQTALNNSTRAASTAYADAAVGVETTRATAAEATKAATLSGTANAVPKFTSSTTIGNSLLTDSGSLLNYPTTGAFITGALHASVTSTVNGSCPNQFDVFAIYGCATTPASGVTNGFTVGVGGYVQVKDPNQGGLFGNVEGVGGYFNVVCAANNTACEGGSSQVITNSGLTGVTVVGHEVSVIPGNTSDTGYGFLADMQGATAIITGDNMPAFAVQKPTAATFTSGFKCEDHSVSTLRCIEVGKQTAGAGVGSQEVYFTANDGSADFSDFFNLSSNGFFQFYNVPLVDGAFGGYLTSTNNLSYNELVKVDTANADSVVACTTADTTACIGFVIDKLGSGTGGNCVATDPFCAVVTTSGSLVKGILGTGTCAIGNYVIVDTTTNGDVKCTATPPAARAEIGLAISAQSTVGQTVDILTKFQ